MLLKKIVPLINDAEKLILIPLNRKIPIIKISANVADYKDFCEKKNYFCAVSRKD